MKTKQVKEMVLNIDPINIDQLRAKSQIGFERLFITQWRNMVLEMLSRANSGYSSYTYECVDEKVTARILTELRTVKGFGIETVRDGMNHYIIVSW